MIQYKPKNCVLCNTTFIPTGKCAKYCPECKVKAKKISQVKGQYAWRRRKGMKEGRGAKIGVHNPMYTHGRCTFRRIARERKESIGLCEYCGKDIKNARSSEWIGHHKDHNKTNNNIDNLILLCKQCHQIEHKCWENFKGVTTISKESRVDNNSKRLAPEKDDDIVCST